MIWTLDEIVDLEFNTQEALWAHWERIPHELRFWCAKPDERLTKEQIAARLTTRLDAQRNFSMRHVVTGARRNWRR